MLTKIRWGGKWVYLRKACSLCYLCAKNFYNPSKFGKVLTKNKFAQFFWDGVQHTCRIQMRNTAVYQCLCELQAVKSNPEKIAQSLMYHNFYFLMDNSSIFYQVQNLACLFTGIPDIFNIMFNTTFPESIACNEEEWKLQEKFTVDKWQEPDWWIEKKWIFERSTVCRHQLSQLPKMPPTQVPTCNKKAQQSWQTSALAMHLPLAR